jgi:hypothetical protein
VKRSSQRLFVKHPLKTKRLLEVLPGVISWALLLLPLWGALLFPAVLVCFLLVFDAYWLYRSFAMAICASLAMCKIKRAERQDWLEQAEALPDFQRVSHVIILPNYKERLEKLRATLQTIAAQTFPLERLFVVLAMEAREAGAQEKAEVLIREYTGQFGAIFATYHPDIAGEVKGKSSNEAYAARVAYRRLVSGKVIDLNYATISSVDADASFDRHYFAYLTTAFLRSPRRYQTFWQSANVTHNNFWQVPSAVRVLSFLESLWRTAVLLLNNRLIVNSTYSLSFKLLVEIGFWDTDVIPEDYRIFFKAFYALHGKVWVEPIFLKTSIDAPRSVGYLRSLKSKFDQEQRWAWGVADTPQFIRWWLTVPHVPFARKTLLLYFVLLDHCLWPSSWFLLTLASKLIPYVNPVFAHSTIGTTLPQLAGLLLTFCPVTTILLALDPRHRPAKQGGSAIRRLLFPFELALMPVAGLFLTALPGMISHTRLMFGRYIEYKVTEKL